MTELEEINDKLRSLEKSLRVQGREMTELKACISIAFNSNDLDEIRKKIKWYCMPYWQYDNFKKEMEEWGTGK